MDEHLQFWCPGLVAYTVAENILKRTSGSKSLSLSLSAFELCSSYWLRSKISFFLLVREVQKPRRRTEIRLLDYRGEKIAPLEKKFPTVWSARGWVQAFLWLKMCLELINGSIGIVHGQVNMTHILIEGRTFHD